MQKRLEEVNSYWSA